MQQQNTVSLSMKLWSACQQNNVNEVITILEQPGCNINIQNNGTYLTPLMHAVYHLDHVIFDIPMQQKPMLNLQDCYKDTALIHAARTQNTYCIHKLMHAGANSNLCNDSGLDSLHTSIRHLWTESIKALSRIKHATLIAEKKTTTRRL